LRVLRISKNDLAEIKKSKVDVSPLFLKLFQMSRKDGSNLSPAEIIPLSKKIGNSPELLLMPLKYTNLRQAANYLGKQYEKNKDTFYGDAHQTLSTWVDNIKLCINLEMDLTQELVLFPRDLHKTHQNLIKQVKVKDDLALSARIAERVKSLGHFRFKYAGLFIRPAESTAELIAEGKALHHCVGTYAERYAKGETAILLIRKAAAPEEPFYTIEIRNGDVTQARGLRNCSPDKAVTTFIEAFKFRKLKKDKQKKIAV